MIFIAKADGSLSRVIPSAVNQGSVGVNELVLIAPYPKYSGVTAAFILPNGIRTKPNLATLTEIADFIEGEHYNAWVFELTSAITEFAGNVTVQFFVTSGKKVLATYSDTFSVAKGAIPEPPGEITEDVYNDILAAYGEASARLLTAESDISSIKADIGADSTYGTIKGRIYTAEMGIQNNASEINQTKSRVSTNEKDISKIEEAIGNDAESSSIKGRIKTAEGDIDDLERRTGNLEDKASEFESDFVIVDGRLTTLEGSASDAATAISALQTSLKNFGIFNRAEYNKTTNTIILWFVKNGEDQKVEIPLEDFLNADELEDEIAAKISALTQEYQASIEQSEANARASETAAKVAQTSAESAAQKAERHESLANQAAGAASTFEASAREARDEAVTAREEAQAASAEARESARKAEMYSQTSEDRWSVFDKRLTNVENGISADPFVTDDSVAYQKTAPANALPFAAIERVGGVSYKSKNLFNGVLDRGYYDANGGYISSSAGYISDYIRIDGKTVTFSAKLIKSGDALRLTSFDGNKNFLERILSSGSSESLTYNNPNAMYVRICVFAGQYDQKTMQLEYRDTATEYEPYFDGIRHAAVTGIESEGANLARTDNGSYVSTNNAGTGKITNTFTDGMLVVDFENWTGGLSSLITREHTKVELPAGTYTYSFTAKGGTTSPGGSYTMFLVKNDTEEIGTMPISYKSWSITFTLDEPATIEWGFYTTMATATTQQTIIKSMLVRGKTALPFAPYYEKETFPITESIRYLPYYGYGINADVNNHIDYENTEYVQMCSERAYQSGDENNPEVVTDGTRTVYALSTPVRTPITFTDNYIRVGGSGTLTFVNAHKLAVPSTVLYLTKEASV